MNKIINERIKNNVKEKEKNIIIGKKNDKNENKKFIPPAGTFDE